MPRFTSVSSVRRTRRASVVRTPRCSGHETVDFVATALLAFDDELSVERERNERAALRRNRVRQPFAEKLPVRVHGDGARIQRVHARVFEQHGAKRKALRAARRDRVVEIDGLGASVRREHVHHRRMILLARRAPTARGSRRRRGDRRSRHPVARASGVCGSTATTRACSPADA